MISLDSEPILSDDLNILSSGHISYNDNNLLEKQLEAEGSKYVKERIIKNTRYSNNKDLTHLVLSAEDRVRVRNNVGTAIANINNSSSSN